MVISLECLALTASIVLSLIVWWQSVKIGRLTDRSNDVCHSLIRLSTDVNELKKKVK